MKETRDSESPAPRAVFARHAEEPAVAGWSSVCYGVAVQDGGLAVVRAQKARGGVICTPLTPNDVAFRAAMAGGAPVVAALSTRKSFTRWLEAPVPSFGKGLKVLPTLLDIQLPFAVEACACHFLDGGGTEDHKTRALAVAARLVDVRERLDQLSEAELDPYALDQDGLALWTQSVREHPPGTGSSDRCRAVVHLNGQQSTLVVGRGFQFAAAHGIHAEDAGQISRLLLSYVEPGQPVDWVWTGPGAADPAAVSDLSNRLVDGRPGSSHTHDDPESFLARAVATRALLPGPLRCNLRNGELTHPALVRRQRRQAVRTPLLMLTAGILLCGVHIALNVVVRGRESAIDRDFHALASDLAGYDIGPAKGEHAIGMATDKARERKLAMAPFLRAFQPSLTETVALVMEVGKKHGLRYERFELADGAAAIRGTSVDWRACEALLDALKEAGLAVTLDRREANAEERIPFAIATEGMR